MIGQCFSMKETYVLLTQNTGQSKRMILFREITMADENKTNAADVALENEPVADAPVAKKQRAPRRSKAAIEAAKAAATAKSPKIKVASQKRGVKDELKKSGNNAPAASDAVEGDYAGSPQNASVVTSAQTSYLPATASDEMADLIALEEENQKLRQALADMLRAENADLRKRLEKY